MLPFSIQENFWSVGFLLLISLLVSSCSSKKIDFNAEVRPIFNEHCASCHGGVKQSGGFGLVFRENAVRETDSGRMGIDPGHPQQSELFHRIVHHDPDERMPEGEDPYLRNKSLFSGSGLPRELSGKITGLICLPQSHWYQSLLLIGLRPR